MLAFLQTKFRKTPASRAFVLIFVFSITFAGVAQTALPPPADARGVLRLRVRIKTGETTKGLSRKRFYLIKGSLLQNRSLIQAIDARPFATRDCYYRSIGASDALINWLRESDCESVYCRDIEPPDVVGAAAVPEFQRALALSERELSNRELARKWLTVQLPENVREGFYKRRQTDLQMLIKQAEQLSGTKVLSVMTDTKGTAYFTELPTGTYVISNLLPTESATTGIVWNCEIQVKPGDLSSEKPFLMSNTRDKSVKCIGVEKPLPACDPALYH